MTASAATPPRRSVEQLASDYAADVAVKRRRFLVAAAVLAVLVLLAGWIAEVDLALFARNIHKFPSYIVRIFHLDSGPYKDSFVLFDVPGWYWGLGKWLRLLADTLLIAYVATLIGAALGFIASFFAAGNLGASRSVSFITRRLLEFCRSVPDLVFAMIFVMAFGLGPVAGVLAIIIHTTGALGKLFYEVLENVDQKPVEGLVASGASWTKTMRFAVLPQVISNFFSYGLLRFEINVRGASVMGFVGAGGIGQELLETIRKYYYPDVSAILMLIVITVFIIDMVTERIRHHFITQVG